MDFHPRTHIPASPAGSSGHVTATHDSTLMANRIQADMMVLVLHFFPSYNIDKGYNTVTEENDLNS